jgi:hypothetical protein
MCSDCCKVMFRGIFYWEAYSAHSVGNLSILERSKMKTTQNETVTSPSSRYLIGFSYEKSEGRRYRQCFHLDKSSRKMYTVYFVVLRQPRKSDVMMSFGHYSVRSAVYYKARSPLSIITHFRTLLFSDHVDDVILIICTFWCHDIALGLRCVAASIRPICVH